jgi:hypothetical protein
VARSEWHPFPKPSSRSLDLMACIRSSDRSIDNNSSRRLQSLSRRASTSTSWMRYCRGLSIKYGSLDQRRPGEVGTLGHCEVLTRSSWQAYASVPTDGSRKTYRTGIVAKQRQKSGSLTKTLDHLEWMREQMLTLQRALERVESDKRGRQIQRPTTRLKIKQF